MDTVLCAAVSGQGWTAPVHTGTSMHGVALAHGQRLNVIQILSVYFRYDHTPLPIDSLYSIMYTPFDLIVYMVLQYLYVLYLYTHPLRYCQPLPTGDWRGSPV